MTITYQPQFKLHTGSTWANFGSPITTTTVTFTGLTPNTLYDLRVQAINEYGSTPSDTVTDTTAANQVVTVPSDPTGVQAARIASLVESFGVNTYSADGTQSSWNSDTLPADYSTSSVIAAINFLTGSSGLKMMIREAHYSTMTWQSAWCQAIFASTGSPFSIYPPYDTTSDDVNPTLVDLATQSSNGTGWIRWIEGQDTPNNVSNDTQPSVEIQQAVWSCAQSLASNAHPVGVLGPSVAVYQPYPEQVILTPGYYSGSDIATIQANMSYIGTHMFATWGTDFSDGSTRGGYIDDYDTGLHIAYGASKPIVVTEYHPTDGNNNGHQYEAEYDAYYTAVFFLSAFRKGWSAWFWWPLFDYGASSPNGLFPVTGGSSPRAAAYTIRAMYTLTGDTGSTKQSFMPGKIDLTITGLQAALSDAPDSGGHSLLFQNSAGTYFLFVWNSQPDPGGPAATVRITFNSHLMSRVDEYVVSNGSASNTTPIQSKTAVSSITTALDASVHLFVIQY